MTTKWPAPAIMIMDDWRQVDPATKPAWGPVGSWKPWDWGQINPTEGHFDWSLIDHYLDRAVILGKPVAISINVQPNWGQDKTPAWVYHNAGVTGGWPGVGSMGTAFTYPRWNDQTWDAAFRAMILALGAKYDNDPRVHSVWACTAGLYGETALTWTDDKTGERFEMTGHNPGLHFSKTLDAYAEAFPTKPVFPIITGQVDRLKLVQQAIRLGLGCKLNGLNHDARLHVQLRPIAGAGTYEVARLAMQGGVPVAWEHHHVEYPAPTYWAMLTGLSSGMVIYDGEIEHLDALAGVVVPGLGRFWDWLLRWMSYPQNRVALWVARDTLYPPPGNGWEHGWPGPFSRGQITVEAKCAGRGSDAWALAPAPLLADLPGYGGIGFCPHGLTAQIGMPEGAYDLTAIYAPDEGTGWEVYKRRLELGPQPTEIVVTHGPCWVHGIFVTPAGDVEPPPPPPPPPDDDLEALRERVAALVNVQETQARSLDNALERLAAIEWAAGKTEQAVADVERQLYQLTALREQIKDIL